MAGVVLFNVNNQDKKTEITDNGLLFEGLFATGVHLGSDGSGRAQVAATQVDPETLEEVTDKLLDAFVELEEGEEKPLLGDVHVLHRRES